MGKSIFQVKAIFTYDGSLNTIFYLNGFATTELRLVDHLSSKYFLDWPQNDKGHNFHTNYQKKKTPTIRREFKVLTI